MIARNYVANHQVKGKQIDDLLEILTPVSKLFPALMQCLTIAMIFGISTASVERSFPHFVESNLICEQPCLKIDLIIYLY